MHETNSLKIVFYMKIRLLEKAIASNSYFDTDLKVLMV